MRATECDSSFLSGWLCPPLRGPAKATRSKRWPGISASVAITEGELAYIWKGVPLFDPSKVRNSHWLIESFLPEGCIQIVYGPPGVFKSTALLKAAKAVSEGEDFFGMKTRQRMVLYLDCENPSDVLKARNEDLGLGIPSPTLTIWDRFHGKPTPIPGDQALEDFVNRYKERTGRLPWLIFDSWTSLLKWGEGGERTGEVAPIYAAIRKLRDRGVTCTTIDHSRKYKSNVIYGSGAKLSLIDLVKMNSNKGLSFETEIVVVVSCEMRGQPFEIRQTLYVKVNAANNEIVPLV
jgi:hypothetical protein